MAGGSDSMWLMWLIAQSSPLYGAHIASAKQNTQCLS